jgi:Holliday junction DNA helicase RuvA
MIGRLHGLLIWKQPPYLMIDIHGVSYELESSLGTFQNLPEVESEVMLFTHLVVREDSHTLYGFSSTEERSLFRNLIRATGIGPRLALLILSGMSIEMFCRCVRDGDTTPLVRLPGIGKKTAERLIIEMRDRIGNSGLKMSSVSVGGYKILRNEVTTLEEDAISALLVLGYKLPEASRMVHDIDSAGMSSEEIIRHALQASVRRS